MKFSFKKLLVTFAVSAAIVLSSCTQSTVEQQPDPADSTDSQNSDKIKIVATIFPIYDWLSEIIGDNSDSIELILLVDSGVDLHSFQPTIEDIATISTADLFVYNGGDSDFWVEDVLAQPINDDISVVNIMELPGIELKSEDIVEGMQEDEHDHDHEEGEDHDHEEGEDHDHEEGEDHDHEEGEDHDHAEGEDHDHAEGEDHDHEGHDDHDHTEDVQMHDGEIVYDEHVWLSLNYAGEICKKLADMVMQLDPQNAEIYSANLDEYLVQLEQLNGEYQNAVDEAGRNILLFADRFPFRYLVDDYDISYYAAFPGCSAETEASFDTIMFLSEKVNEFQLEQIVIIDGSDEKLATKIIESSESKSADIIEFNSLQSVNAKDIEEGATYLSIMESNLQALTTALSS